MHLDNVTNILGTHLKVPFRREPVGSMVPYHQVSGLPPLEESSAWDFKASRTTAWYSLHSLMLLKGLGWSIFATLLELEALGLQLFVVTVHLFFRLLVRLWQLRRYSWISSLAWLSKQLWNITSCSARPCNYVSIYSLRHSHWGPLSSPATTHHSWERWYVHTECCRIYFISLQVLLYNTIEGLKAFSMTPFLFWFSIQLISFYSFWIFLFLRLGLQTKDCRVKKQNGPVNL